MALAGGISALLASNNWCVVVVPAALAAGLFDYVFAWRQPFLIRFGAGAIWGAVIGAALRIGPGWAFQEAFASPLPSGVRGGHVWRHFLGGPGEHILILEFTADGPAIQQLLRDHHPAAESDRLAAWRAHNEPWADVLALCFPERVISRFARASWDEIRPLKNPQAFDLGESNRGDLLLFREPDTGRCVAVHVRY